jgi:hypothetical protein
MKQFLAACGVLNLCFVAVCSAVTPYDPIVPDLSRISDGKTWKIDGRKATAVDKDGKRVVRLDERAGYGVAWLPGVLLANGTIECDLRGKNVDQKSFLGIAFHGLDESTYDAVYFRPFNFKSSDPVCKSHAVQYVCHPDNPWTVLRQNHPGKYEKPVQPPPDPDNWFHVRIVLSSPKVIVFVNGAKEPELVVEQLCKRGNGWVGFWVGDDSGGDFANLKIAPG